VRFFSHLFMFLFIYLRFLAVLTRTTTTTTHSANDDGKTAEMGPSDVRMLFAPQVRCFLFYFHLFVFLFINHRFLTVLACTMTTTSNSAEKTTETAPSDIQTSFAPPGKVFFPVSFY
jgi:hypothetical protein